jgi:hypothetical protein
MGLKAGSAHRESPLFVTSACLYFVSTPHRMVSYGRSRPLPPTRAAAALPPSISARPVPPWTRSVPAPAQTRSAPSRLRTVRGPHPPRTAELGGAAVSCVREHEERRRWQKAPFIRRPTDKTTSAELVRDGLPEGISLHDLGERPDEPTP